MAIPPKTEQPYYLEMPQMLPAVSNGEEGEQYILERLEEYEANGEYER